VATTGAAHVRGSRLASGSFCMVSDGGVQVWLTTLSSCTRIVFANYEDNLIQIFVSVFFTLCMIKYTRPIVCGMIKEKCTASADQGRETLNLETELI
jgi:hypothetical protein